MEQHDPEELRKYRENQAEKKAYEKELKNCKTKEEVDRVKMNKLGHFASQAKKITTNPYIPLEKKLELMNQLNDKVCRINQAHMEFIDSEKYRDMPAEAELSEERAEKFTDNNDVKLAEYEKPEEDSAESADEVSDLDEKEKSFEKLEESIRKFAANVGNNESTIDISL